MDLHIIFRINGPVAGRRAAVRSHVSHRLIFVEWDTHDGNVAGPSRRGWGWALSPDAAPRLCEARATCGGEFSSKLQSYFGSSTSFAVVNPQ